VQYSSRTDIKIEPSPQHDLYLQQGQLGHLLSLQILESTPDPRPLPQTPAAVEREIDLERGQLGLSSLLILETLLIYVVCKHRIMGVSGELVEIRSPSLQLCMRGRPRTKTEPRMIRFHGEVTKNRDPYLNPQL